jgi:hypothetical protein
MTMIDLHNPDIPGLGQRVEGAGIIDEALGPLKSVDARNIGVEMNIEPLRWLLKHQEGTKFVITLKRRPLNIAVYGRTPELSV